MKRSDSVEPKEKPIQKLKISIIIVNYNNYKITLDCLKSLEKQDFKNFEVIIIENGSTRKNEFENLKNCIEQFQETLNIKCIKSKYNLGFTGGNNKGLKYCSGDIICLLNDDTVVDNNFLSSCLEILQSDSQIGIVSPKILFYEKPNIIWYAGAEVFKKPKINKLKLLKISAHRGKNQKDIGQFDQIEETDYACGCAFLIKKEIVDMVGLFDDIYFMYSEDLDLSFKTKLLGYKLVFNPETKVYHKIVRNKEISKLKVYLTNRNLLIFIQKYYTPSKLINILLVYFIFDFSVRIFFYSTEIIKNIFSKKNKLFIKKLLYFLRSTIIGLKLGLKRRINKNCRKEILKEYNFLMKIS